MERPGPDASGSSAADDRLAVRMRHAAGTHGVVLPSGAALRAAAEQRRRRRGRSFGATLAAGLIAGGLGVGAAIAPAGGGDPAPVDRVSTPQVTPSPRTSTPPPDATSETSFRASDLPVSAAALAEENDPLWRSDGAVRVVAGGPMYPAAATSAGDRRLPALPTPCGIRLEVGDGRSLLALERQEEALAGRFLLRLADAEEAHRLMTSLAAAVAACPDDPSGSVAGGATTGEVRWAALAGLEGEESLQVSSRSRSVALGEEWLVVRQGEWVWVGVTGGDFAPDTLGDSEDQGALVLAWSKTRPSVLAAVEGAEAGTPVVTPPATQGTTTAPPQTQDTGSGDPGGGRGTSLFVEWADPSWQPPAVTTSVEATQVYVPADGEPGRSLSALPEPCAQAPVPASGVTLRQGLERRITPDSPAEGRYVLELDDDTAAQDVLDQLTTLVASCPSDTSGPDPVDWSTFKVFYGNAGMLLSAQGRGDAPDTRLWMVIRRGAFLWVGTAVEAAGSTAANEALTESYLASFRLVDAAAGTR